MKMKIGIIVMSLSLGYFSFAKTTVDDGVIDSVYSIEALLIKSRLQYLPVSPPTSDPYVDIRENVVPVNWKSFKSKVFTSQMYAEMDTNGFPIYRVGIRQDFWTGETVFHNSYRTEVLRLAPAEKNYDPYAWAKDYFQVSSVAELSKMQRILYPSSKIELEIVLLPEIFYPTYLELKAEQKTKDTIYMADFSPAKRGNVSVGMALAPMEATATPLVMTAMSSSSPPPPGGGGGNTNNISGGGSSNLVVELSINLPVDFGNYLEIFQKNDLIYDPSWEIAFGANWIPTYGSTNILWMDPTSTNQPNRFYMLSPADIDSDGDGYSDLREAYISITDSNSFNSINTDGDDLHDWWETKLFGGLGQIGSGDYDGDGLLNSEELISVSAGQSATMVSDPSLYDTDDDGKNDFTELRGSLLATDPWNNDVSAPAAIVLWPTNNLVIVP